jgi:hypothetical protein
VGQVYGHHLQRAGARIAFLVKSRHAETARAGYDLFAKNGTSRQPERFEGADGRADVAAKLLRKGGCPAKRATDVGVTGAKGSAILLPTVAALECA